MSANEYARQRGVDLPPEPETAPRVPRRPPPPLTERQQARVAENRALVLEHIPEAVPFIKDLHELGMIDGWRSVESVEVFADHKQGGLP